MSEAAVQPLALRDPGALADPASHPGDASAEQGVEWIQTHISHVFLTGARVYKLRKAVDLGFLCFASREQRNADCLAELTLNRRLSPDVYLGVAPLLVDGAGVRVGPVGEALVPGPRGEVLEHCVVMRRLPAGRDALSLLERGELAPAHLEAVAERIARLHARTGLGTPAPFSADDWRERCLAPLEANFTSLEHSRGLPERGAPLARAREGARRFARAHGDRLERRRLGGRAVDGHGDLHLQHVWFEGAAAEPRIVDCLEFSDALRRIDAASEVAFLAMDLRYRGAPELAECFLRAYARERDDFDLYGVVDFFASYRAGVRAKVAALAAADPAIGPAQRERAAGSARRHLELAAALLEPPPRAALVLVAGGVGTGKSTVAGALADALGAVVIASDRVRKALLGVAPQQRLGAAWRRGAYAPEVGERVYAALLERARPVLESGRVAVLDATFGRRRHREAARGLASELGVPCSLVVTRCGRDTVLERLARRAARGDDPSDAGPDLFEPSRAAFEGPDEWPDELRAEVRTDDPAWRSRIPPIAARVRPPTVHP